LLHDVEILVSPFYARKISAVSAEAPEHLDGPPHAPLITEQPPSNDSPKLF
jgi:hypothetical protein